MLDQLIEIINNHESKLIKSKVLQIVTNLVDNKYVDVSKMDVFISFAVWLINETRNAFIFSHSMNFLGQLFVTINIRNPQEIMKIANIRNMETMNINLESPRPYQTKEIYKEFENITLKYVFLKDEEIFINLLRNYLRNNDKTILCCVLKTIINVLALKRYQIDFEFYLKCCELLENENEEVCLIAIDLNAFLSQYMGKMRIDSLNNYSSYHSNIKGVFLADDIFMNLCGVVRCDNSTKVQYKALVVLRNVLPVTSECMEQSMNKELISNHKAKKSFHQLQRERYGMIFDGFETDNIQNEDDVNMSSKNQKTDIPLSSSKSDNSSAKNESHHRNTLLKNSSLRKRSHHGTFIDVLEVEFCQIRTAAIDTLYCIASRNNSSQNMKNGGEILNNACDLLIDSINDSVPNVRFEAIRKLTSLMGMNKISSENSIDSKMTKSTKFIQHNVTSVNELKLSDHQLYATLDALSDVSFDIRKQIYHLLMNSKLSSSLSLYSAIIALINNLNSYPDDKWFIWQCCQQFGLKHGSFVPAMIYTLFGFHPFYINIQPHLSDNKYVAHAILAFNAASTYPPLISLLPDFSAKHHTFLRNLHPDLVPHLCFNDGNISYNYLESLSIVDISKTPQLLQQQVLCSFAEFFNNQQRSLHFRLTGNMESVWSIKSVADFSIFHKTLIDIQREMSKIKFNKNHSVISHQISFHLDFFNLIVAFSQFIKNFTLHNSQKSDLEFIKSLVINAISIIEPLLCNYHKYKIKNSANLMIFCTIEFYLNVWILYSFAVTDMMDAKLFFDILQKCSVLFIQKLHPLSQFSEIARFLSVTVVQFLDQFSAVISEDPHEQTGLCDDENLKKEEYLIFNKVRHFLDWSTWIHLIAQIPLSFVDDVQFCGALVVSPYQSISSLHKFQSITQLTIPFHCVIFNVQQTDIDVSILTKFPNNSYVLYCPSEYEQKPQGNNLNVISELRLRCFPWSNAGTVLIGPTLKIETGVFHLIPHSLVDFLYEIHSNFNQIFLLVHGLIELADPVPIKIHPHI